MAGNPARKQKRCEGLTSYGMAALNRRGDLPMEGDTLQVFTVGLFNGFGALRLALDSLGVAVAGQLSVEKEGTGRRVVEAFFPDSIFHDDARTVDEEMVKRLALRFPSVALARGRRFERIQERCPSRRMQLSVSRGAGQYDLAGHFAASTVAVDKAFGDKLGEAVAVEGQIP